jgi:myo-inositol 2-dehydrogenase/D-chiro-inositol 1-dehydrogenase
METNRRDFLKKTSLLAAGSLILPSILTPSFGMPTIVPASVLGKKAPSNRINIAVIGCGRQSVSPNIPQLLRSEHAQVLAVCDVDSWRLSNAQKQVNDYYSKQKGSPYNGCKAIDDYRKIMQNKDIDAVMISLPDHWHVPMAIEAARAGKHISLEKPISTCIEHGRKLVQAIKKHNVITRNDSEFRTLPKMSRAVELVRNGRIGTLQKIYVGVPPDMNGTALAHQPNMTIPQELNYDLWLGPAWEAPYTEKRVHAIQAYGRPGWMRIDAYCNGMISNWGAHLMGIAQWGNNSEYTGPISVEGTGTFDKGLWNTVNNFNLQYKYENGVELFYKIERPYVRFEGTEGWVEIEYPDKLTASSQAILDSKIGDNEMKIENLPSDKEDFCLAVKSGKQSLEPLETAHRTISMCQLGLISMKTESKLIWDPKKEEIVNDNAASAMLNIPIREKYFKF